MRICGIVSEFNPFHNGHKYLLDQIRKELGPETAIISVMSGNFVQRGEAACYEKHTRAAAAVASGVDLIFEIPFPWSSASAEFYAGAALNLLANTGIVTDVAFGSECGNIDELNEIVSCLMNPCFDERLSFYLKTGISYAKAREKAAEELLGREGTILTFPNDILAVEYLKAIKKNGYPFEVHPIQRVGAKHDSLTENHYPSASFLREKLELNETVNGWIPKEAETVFSECNGTVNKEMIDTAIISRLRVLNLEAFSALPDASEGLDRRMFQASRTAGNLRELVKEVSTKRYTEARARRMALFASLQITREDISKTPPYLQLLSCNQRGLTLLHDMKRTAVIPVITKPSQIRKLGEKEVKVFSTGAMATDLFALGMRTLEEKSGEKEWKTSPVILDK